MRLQKLVDSVMSDIVDVARKCRLILICMLERHNTVIPKYLLRLDRGLHSATAVTDLPKTTILRYRGFLNSKMEHCQLCSRLCW